MRRAACKAANPLKIRASLGQAGRPRVPAQTVLSQSLKDQGKSRTSFAQNFALLTGSQSLKDQGKSRTGKIDSIQARSAKSQSLKDQGKSRTCVIDSMRELADVAIP